MRIQAVVKAITLLFVGTFFFCQILGSWCPMLPTARAAQPTIQQLHDGHLHADHTMGQAMCPDSLTATRHGDSSNVASLFSGQPAVALASPVEVRTVSVLTQQEDGAAEGTPHLPLYTLLSTYRI